MKVKDIQNKQSEDFKARMVTTQAIWQWRDGFG